MTFLYQALLDDESHVPRVASLTTLSGYVHERLTGEQALSVGDASGMFPIDPDTGTYDARLVEGYDALLAEHGSNLRIEGLLSRVLMAGECAGRLTPEGACLIDPEGDLEPGCPLCPPEGDAGTGMIATGALELGSCNVSVGTSIFSMTVLEGPCAILRARTSTWS